MDKTQKTAEDSAVFCHSAAADISDEEIKEIDDRKDAKSLKNSDEDMSFAQL